jgi:integrase
VAHEEPRRRDRGSGSYRWRSSGAVELRVWDPERRKQLTRNVRAINDTAARRELVAFVAEVLKDQAPAGKARKTVAQVANEWLAYKEDGGRAGDATLSNYDYHVRRHILPELGSRPVRKLKAIDLEEHYAKLQSPSKDRRGLSPRTINDVAGVLFQILEYARRRDYIRTNVAKDVEQRPSGASSTLVVPEDGDVRKFLEKTQELDFTMFCYVLVTAATGGRRGEVLALRRRDLLLDEGIVWFRSAITWRRRKKDSRGRVIEGPTLIVKEPKTAAGRRRVAIGQGVIDVLREHLRRLDDLARKDGRDGFPVDGFLFGADLFGERPLYPSTINGRFRRISEKAEVKVRPHALRHYAATVVAPTLTETEMMGRFGWRSSAMVKRYAEYRAQRDAEAAALMDRALGLETNVVPIESARSG